MTQITDRSQVMSYFPVKFPKPKSKVSSHWCEQKIIGVNSETLLDNNRSLLARTQKAIYDDLLSILRHFTAAPPESRERSQLRQLKLGCLPYEVFWERPTGRTSRDWNTFFPAGNVLRFSWRSQPMQLWRGKSGPLFLNCFPTTQSQIKRKMDGQQRRYGNIRSVLNQFHQMKMFIIINFESQSWSFTYMYVDIIIPSQEYEYIITRTVRGIGPF